MQFSQARTCDRDKHRTENSSGSLTLFSPDLFLKGWIFKTGNMNENLGYIRKNYEL